jgi:hypothetical protein
MAFIFNDGSGSTLDMVAATAFGSAVYRLKELLKLAGWVHEASSDGTNVSNTSGNANDQIGSAAEMRTANAWFVLSQPAIASGIGSPGNRQIIIRQGSGGTVYLIVYVPPNTDGTKQAKTANGTTTAIPTYATSQPICGTLPDNASNWNSSSVASNNFVIGADNAPPYGWYFASFTTAAGDASNASPLWMDFMVPGSYDVADLDPCVIGCVHPSNGWLESIVGSPDTVSSPSFYQRYGLAGSTFVQGCMLSYRSGSSVVVPAMLGRGQFSPLKESQLPLFYAYAALGNGPNNQAAGLKGMSYMLRWRNGGYPLGTLLTRVAAGDRAVIGDVEVPWDGSTQLVRT